MPKRIQRKRTKGWKMPAGTVYVGRPTKWGNPFGPREDLESSLANFKSLVEDLQRRGIVMCPVAPGTCGWILANMLLQIEQLRGKDLACWCPLDQHCHADVLLELANR